MTEKVTHGENCVDAAMAISPARVSYIASLVADMWVK